MVIVIFPIFGQNILVVMKSALHGTNVVDQETTDQVLKKDSTQ